MYKNFLMSKLNPLEQLAIENHGAWLDFQAELIQYRIVRGITQAEVARRLGTTQPAVSQIESSTKVPSMNSILLYSLAIGARISFSVSEPEGHELVSRELAS
jgi:transcriptional regulator with XRE-family HTH domain